MKVILNEEKARNIRIAYLSFIILSIASLILCQFHIVLDFVIFGAIASGVAFGMYGCLFFLNLKLLIKYKWLFVGNIFFIFTNLSFVIQVLWFELRGMSELILVVLATTLFILISPKTLKILLKRYNPENGYSITNQKEGRDEYLQYME